ncbi:MAG: DUF3575 domain-containing protein [Gelidibacter sp.]
MKNYVVAFLMLFAVLASQAQNDSIPKNNFGKNEIKVNALFLLLGTFEGSYERNLSENSAIGMSVLIPFEREFIENDINYYVSPYYRVFFGKKYAAGFFLEGFGMLNSIRTSYRYYIDSGTYHDIESTTDFALGLGLGGKWFTKGGFVFEINGGLGRNLFNAGNDNAVTFVGKLGFNMGYRF